MGLHGVQKQKHQSYSFFNLYFSLVIVDLSTNKLKFVVCPLKYIHEYVKKLIDLFAFFQGKSPEGWPTEEMVSP
jgi:hypothetical protein